MGTNASRYHGKAPDEIVWAEPERQTRARHSTLFPDGDMRRDAGANQPPEKLTRHGTYRRPTHMS
jgi:hypothetical protein